jgi:hypothetical protein
LHDPSRYAGDDARKIARLKFQPASKSFAVFMTAVFETAAVQRGWRDFRIAPSSCERGDFGCQKIGRLRRMFMNGNSGGSDESARRRQQVLPRQT